jgi:hypothetical protein
MLALVGYLAAGLFLHLSYARYFWLMLALAGAAAAVILEVTEGPPTDVRGRARRGSGAAAPSSEAAAS